MKLPETALRSLRKAVGSLLPTELDLCAHYGTSRHTVRTAIRQLQEQGLVTRNKKAGTRVEATAPTTGYRQALASLEDLVQFGEAHVREVQATGPVTAGESSSPHASTMLPTATRTRSDEA